MGRIKRATRMVASSLGALALVGVLSSPAAAYEFPAEGLAPGVKGVAVKALQVRVAGWYPRADQTYFPIDGAYSDMTVVAVRRFQRFFDLEITGIADPLTLAKINTLQDSDGTTIHFDYDEFWQNENHACSDKANRYAGTFKGGMVREGKVKKNVRRLMWRLEAIRYKAGGHPVVINSGYRSVPYNNCIGGASASQHMYGTAADFRIAKTDNRLVRDVGRGSQSHGIGCYSSLSHNHFDLRLSNEALHGAQFWWWPKQDRRGRDLADDARPCWGETVKRESSINASGPTVGVMNADALTEASHRELLEWGETEHPLHGAD